MWELVFVADLVFPGSAKTLPPAWDCNSPSLVRCAVLSFFFLLSLQAVLIFLLQCSLVTFPLLSLQFCVSWFVPLLDRSSSLCSPPYTSSSRSAIFLLPCMLIFFFLHCIMRHSFTGTGIPPSGPPSGGFFYLVSLPQIKFC